MINNVTLVGRLTKDPELKYTSGGNATANFTLAVNRSFKNQNGEREADFINCVIWRKQAETLANYAKKGKMIGVTGRIQTRSYENSQGQRVYVTEVVAESFQLLDYGDRSSNNGDTGVPNGREGNNARSNRNGYKDDLQGNNQNDNFAHSIDISDDELPF